jgi:RNA polymerase sigma-70 factor (ECF subfamily)
MMDSTARPQSPDRAMAEPTGAFVRRIYESHFDYVWHTLRRLGVRAAELEDVAHEVFIVVQRKAADFDRARPEKPWLFGIAFRVAADQKRLARHSRETSLDRDPADQRAGADATLEAADRRRIVEHALAALPLEQRAVFIMHDIDEQTMPEIARALDVPLATAYSRLRLGRATFTDAARREAKKRGLS